VDWAGLRARTAEPALWPRSTPCVAPCSNLSAGKACRRQPHPLSLPLAPLPNAAQAVLAAGVSSDAAAARAAAKAERRAANRGADEAAAPAAAAGAATGGTTAASTAAPVPALPSSSSGAGSEAAEEAALSSGGRLRANVGAAAVAALVGAVVEAPVELFKHQLQNGTITGSILGHMGAAVRTGGPAALFVSALPFCLKSLPFDTAELVTYSSLQDSVNGLAARPEGPALPGAAGGPGAALAAAARRVADHPGLDLALGAAAGAVACVVSMPMDTVKTVIETGSGAAAAGGAAHAPGGAAAYGATARALVARHGPGALFSGLGMRLAEQVPSTAVSCCLGPLLQEGVGAAGRPCFWCSSRGWKACPSPGVLERSAHPPRLHPLPPSAALLDCRRGHAPHAGALRRQVTPW
jgi:hypothetical protein